MLDLCLKMVKSLRLPRIHLQQGKQREIKIMEQ